MRNRLVLVTAVSLLLNLYPNLEVLATSCDALLIGDKPLSVFQRNQNNIKAVFFLGRLKLDFDGAPNAYAPKGVKDQNGNPPLDNLGNAGHPGNWWGLETDTGLNTGIPLVQKKVNGDPYPDFYISRTALQNGKEKRISKRNVDARFIPYIVLPPKSFDHGPTSMHIPHNIRLGDFAVVFDPSTNQSAGAIFADTKEDTEGEASIALAKLLGLPQGADKQSIYYIVFPGSGNGWIDDPAIIEATAQHLIKTWGNMDPIKACLGGTP